MRRICWTVWSIVAAAGCGGSPSANEPGKQVELPAITAYVHGPLAEADLAKAQAAHDQLVDGGAKAARDAGDVAHHVYVGTGEPSPERKGEFLALDEWISLDGPKTVYGDPNFQKGFSALFAKPVMPELYRRRPDWHTWGDLKKPSGEYWVMTVKGHLAKATEEENRKAHDAVASGFQEAAMKAGDIAHVPHLGVEDPRIFFNIDVSTNHEGMLAALMNPQFQQAFGALFDAPPEVHIYRGTDWKQW